MTDGGTCRNLLLDTLSPDTLRALNGRAEYHDVTKVLLKEDEIPQYVFFPCRGAVVSIVRSTEDGAMVEAGVVGSEGVFSVQTVITDPALTGGQAIVQVRGVFTRVDASVLRHYFHTDIAFRQRLLAFTSTFLEQITQNLVCNRLHAIEQRLAKWLLLVRDRIETNDMPLTHDFLAHMLGIHRPGVSIAVTALELDGLISHSRSLITIRDMEGLQKRACECFAVLHANLTKFRSSFPD
jgi:CRP-like cAMP-binding protein